MNIQSEISGKNIVVIGGTSGINRGIAEYFAGLGANIAVASRKQEKVDDTVRALEQLGASAFGATCDVRNANEVKKLFKKIFEAMGDIDVLVSGAAGNFPALATGMSPNGFRSVVEIDLLGTFHVMQSAYPYLKKPGASVINISAPQAELPVLAQSHVCSAKAGVDMITRCLALEWGTHGIRINSIIPGPIFGTEGMKRLAPSPDLLNNVTQSVPLKRLGTATDIAQTAAFLSSSFASYISGAVIPVDGGWSLGGATVLSPVLETALKTQPR